MAGRRSKYDPDVHPLLAEQYCREGYIDAEIAKSFGIHVSTFYDWQNKYVEFSDAIKKGKFPVDIKVEQSLYKRAMGFEFEEEHIIYAGTGKTAKIKEVRRVKKYVAPDIAAIIFWLKNRRRDRWPDKQQVQVDQTHRIDDAILAIVEKLTPNELRKIAYGEITGPNPIRSEPTDKPDSEAIRKDSTG